MAQTVGSICLTFTIFSLFRGLEFMLEMLLGLVQMYRNHDQSDSLHGLLSECYEKTLKFHHGFISRQLFKVVLLAAPSRTSLIKTVAYGKDGYNDYCYQVNFLTAFLKCFSDSSTWKRILKTLNTVFIRLSNTTSTKV